MNGRLEIEHWAHGFIVRLFTDEGSDPLEKHWKIRCEESISGGKGREKVKERIHEIIEGWLPH